MDTDGLDTAIDSLRAQVKSARNSRDRERKSLLLAYQRLNAIISSAHLNDSDRYLESIKNDKSLDQVLAQSERVHALATARIKSEAQTHLQNCLDLLSNDSFEGRRALIQLPDTPNININNAFKRWKAELEEDMAKNYIRVHSPKDGTGMETVDADAETDRLCLRVLKTEATAGDLALSFHTRKRDLVFQVNVDIKHSSCESDSQAQISCQPYLLLDNNQKWMRFEMSILEKIQKDLWPCIVRQCEKAAFIRVIDTEK